MFVFLIFRCYYFTTFRHLSEEGIDIITENGQIEDVNILSRRAIDVSRVKIIINVYFTSKDNRSSHTLDVWNT